ncbi:hypothetical protein [Agrobacterium tumefaciens]|uniref:hypothetical protein n=1 Tax=Agrobacterium tumefaciens TaxID=358 RepID=UPI000976AD2C|nr:hypothetical protein BV900_27255 [Agrobacterium tumefaciens]
MTAKQMNMSFTGPAPDAALFDISLWPIVSARFPELDEPGRLNRVLDGLDRLLEQRSGYVLIWTPASHHHDKEPHDQEKASNLWIKRRKVAINTYCQGYIYVVQDPAFERELRAQLKKVSTRLFCFPMIIEQTPEAALSTAQGLIRQMD